MAAWKTDPADRRTYGDVVRWATCPAAGGGCAARGRAWGRRSSDCVTGWRSTSAGRREVGER
jgi:hypothetical protein